MANITVKPLSDAASKWSTNAGAGADRQQKNMVANASKFAANSEAAAANFQQAVTSGNIGNRYASGIRRKGAAKYAAAAVAKAGHFSSGVSTPAAQQNWQQGFSPYGSALSSLDPGPRGPRGDPRNLQRVATVANTLHQLRAAQMSAGV